MADIGNISKSKQIRTLLYVVIAGVVTASALSLSMLYYYNPAGTYLAKNVLLSPETAFSLQIPDGNSKTKGSISFDHIDFSYYDVASRSKKVIKVGEGGYSAFYNLVKDGVSVQVPDVALQNRFSYGHPAILMIKVKDSTKTSESIFSQIDFAEGGDYFRVQLRQQGAGVSWVYFYYPGIYERVLKLLSASP